MSIRVNYCNKFSDGIIMVLLVTGGGVDYTSGPYTVTFLAGETNASFNVPINDDNIFEGNETFNITIASLPGDCSVGAVDNATVLIVDDDCK